jgi:hypothetical protein
VMMQQTKGVGACKTTHGRKPAKIELRRVALRTASPRR